MGIVVLAAAELCFVDVPKVYVGVGDGVVRVVARTYAKQSAKV